MPVTIQSLADVAALANVLERHRRQHLGNNPYASTVLSSALHEYRLALSEFVQAVGHYRKQLLDQEDRQRNEAGSAPLEKEERSAFFEAKFYAELNAHQLDAVLKPGFMGGFIQLISDYEALPSAYRSLYRDDAHSQFVLRKMARQQAVIDVVQEHHPALAPNERAALLKVIEQRQRGHTVRLDDDALAIDETANQQQIGEVNVAELMTAVEEREVQYTNLDETDSKQAQLSQQLQCYLALHDKHQQQPDSLSSAEYVEFTKLQPLATTFGQMLREPIPGNTDRFTETDVGRDNNLIACQAYAGQVNHALGNDDLRQQLTARSQAIQALSAHVDAILQPLHNTMCEQGHESTADEVATSAALSSLHQQLQTHSSAVAAVLGGQDYIEKTKAHALLDAGYTLPTPTGSKQCNFDVTLTRFVELQAIIQKYTAARTTLERIQYYWEAQPLSAQNRTQELQAVQVQRNNLARALAGLQSSETLMHLQTDFFGWGAKKTTLMQPVDDCEKYIAEYPEERLTQTRELLAQRKDAIDACRAHLSQPAYQAATNDSPAQTTAKQALSALNRRLNAMSDELSGLLVASNTDFNSTLRQQDPDKYDDDLIRVANFAQHNVLTKFQTDVVNELNAVQNRYESLLHGKNQDKKQLFSGLIDDIETYTRHCNMPAALCARLNDSAKAVQDDKTFLCEKVEALKQKCPEHSNALQMILNGILVFFQRLLTLNKVKHNVISTKAQRAVNGEASARHHKPDASKPEVLSELLLKKAIPGVPDPRLAPPGPQPRSRRAAPTA